MSFSNYVNRELAIQMGSFRENRKRELEVSLISNDNFSIFGIERSLGVVCNGHFSVQLFGNDYCSLAMKRNKTKPECPYLSDNKDVNDFRFCLAVYAISNELLFNIN